MPSTMLFSLTTGLETWSQMTLDWNLWNHDPKYILPPLSCFCQVFCHSDEKSDWRRKWLITFHSPPFGQFSKIITMILTFSHSYSLDTTTVPIIQSESVPLHQMAIFHPRSHFPHSLHTGFLSRTQNCHIYSHTYDSPFFLPYLQ
jgi:hypothetical protein